MKIASLVSISLLLTAFVSWLFYSTYHEVEIERYRLELQERQISLFEDKEERLALGSYRFFDHADGHLYLLNEADGTTWRWFIDRDSDGNFTGQGWTEVPFVAWRYKFTNPQLAAEKSRERAKFFRDLRQEHERKESTKMLEEEGFELDWELVLPKEGP